MAHPRFPLVQLVVANVLLIAALFIPWFTVASMPAGVSIIQAAVPILVLWNTLVSAPDPDPVRLALPSLIYLVAALEVFGLSILLVRRIMRGNRMSTLALAALPGAFICLLIALFGGPLIFLGLSFGNQFTHITFGFGILLAFLGAILALVGLTKLAK